MGVKTIGRFVYDSSTPTMDCMAEVKVLVDSYK